jgi:hypothetical protein
MYENHSPPPPLQYRPGEGEESEADEEEAGGCVLVDVGTVREETESSLLIEVLLQLSIWGIALLLLVTAALLLALVVSDHASAVVGQEPC